VRVLVPFVGGSGTASILGRVRSYAYDRDPTKYDPWGRADRTQTLSPLDIPHDDGYAPLYIPEVIGVSDSESSILQGTLDLMVLKTLEHLGPLHGYGIARRIEQVGERALTVNQGTVYLCLVRLVQKKWIRAEWGVSDNNRKAKFYSLTKAGRKQLQAETENWERIAGVMSRVLNPQAGS